MGGGCSIANGALEYPADGVLRRQRPAAPTLGPGAAPDVLAVAGRRWHPGDLAVAAPQRRRAVRRTR